MSSPVHSYLRTNRREWALTQKELAFLFGRKSSTHISRLEQGKRVPPIDIVLASEILFDKTPRALYPQFYAAIEEEVLARASRLYERLEHKKNNTNARKKEFLAIVLKRAIIRLNETKGI